MPAAPTPASWLDALVLFCLGVGAARAPALLDELAAPARERARTAHERYASVSADRRRELLVRTFNLRPDAERQLELLFGECDPPMRSLVLARLPADLCPRSLAVAPRKAVRATRLAHDFATRLLREALR